MKQATPARDFVLACKVLDQVTDEVLTRLESIDRPERVDRPAIEIKALDALDALALLMFHKGEVS